MKERVARFVTTIATPRRCRDGLVHWVEFTKTVKGWDAPGLWLRVCDGNDDFVTVTTLPLERTDITCVACLALESRGDLHTRAD